MGRSWQARGRHSKPSVGPGEKLPSPKKLSPWGLQVLMEWINTTLLPEHIVVRSLEEDMFDGLILHHLFRKWPFLGLPGPWPHPPDLAPPGPTAGLSLSGPAMTPGLGTPVSLSRWAWAGEMEALSMAHE